MALLRQAPRPDLEMLKVFRFVLGLIGSLRARFKGLMPQTLHDVVLKADVQDKFSFIERASEANQKVGGKVTGCAINQGEFVMRDNLYVTILGSYDVVIGMDWLETHEANLNFKTKRLSLVDDEGQRLVIVGRNQGVSLRFVSSLQLRKSMRKGCKLYAILALNEKGVAEGLEHLPVVKELRTYFQRSCLGCHRKGNWSLP
jgi:hypothetical protein